MSQIEGYITTSGGASTVTLTTGSLPAWDGSINTFLNAQVFAYDSNNNLITPPTGSSPLMTPVTVASIFSSTSFTITPALGISGTTGTLNFILSKQWDAVLSRFQYNFSSFTRPLTTATATVDGWGYAGSDGGTSIDLSPLGYTGSIWFFDDSSWGASSDTGNNRSQISFVHNSVFTQVGNHLATDAISFQILTVPGQGPAPLFDLQNNNISWWGNNQTTYSDGEKWFWPQGGYCTSTYMLVFAAATGRVSTGLGYSGVQTAFRIPGFTTGGVTGVMSGSSSASPGTINPPHTWSITEIPLTYAGQSDYGPPANPLSISGDSTYYYWFVGNGKFWGQRFKRADLSNNDWSHPQTYVNDIEGWVEEPQYQYQNDQISLPLASKTKTLFGPQFNGSNYNYKITAGFYQKSTSQLIFATIQYNYFPSSGTYMQYSTANNFTDVWSTPLSFYYLPGVSPSGNGFGNFGYYDVNAHPQQTWTGKTTDDMMFTVDNNFFGGSVGVFQDSSSYWPTPIRVTGI